MNESGAGGGERRDAAGEGGGTAFLFPGQGSQSVGMRARLGPRSKAQDELFERAEAVLGFALGRLIDEGPEPELTRTSNAQPALLVMDLAHAEGLRARGLEADVVLGHSLGEYAALVHAGALAFEDAVRVVRARGRVMEEAARRTPGRMAAVIKVPLDVLRGIVEECSGEGVLEITNFNGPDQLVVSGETAAVEAAVETIRERRLGRAVPLNVSAPFHSSLMVPAAEAFRVELGAVELRAPRLAFIDNVTGGSETDPLQIRRKLVQQIVAPVRWEPSVRTALALGVARFLESGPGSVLAALARRIAPPGTAVATSESILATA
ncbi:MAG: ACP S-malonyltransferase [Deltaproteobacteria bacterium]|nr:ACP S-malonyltransferase [Deltaproteobacteria bacterium]